MNYIEKCLIPGEAVLYRARLHWTALGWRAFVGLCLTCAAVGLFVGAWLGAPHGKGPSPLLNVAGLITLASGIVLLLMGFIRRNATEIAVTNRRVLIKTGILRRSTVEVLLSKIESIGVDEPLSGRLLGYGTVIVRGTGGTPETFTRIARPLEFRRQVQGQIDGLLAEGGPLARRF
jgi:Bacterial PH domain